MPSTTQNQPALSVQEFFMAQVGHHELLDSTIIGKALELCLSAHNNQFRKSGEPYYSHAVETAKILVDLRMDTSTICAGLLHDTVEDTDITLDYIKKLFGETVATLVDGVTKISNIPFKSTEEMQVETYRKMLLSTAKDIRVLVIKLADRLHNLRTLQYMPSSSIQKIAAESLNVYVPLAHRLGMAKIRLEMEDIAFRYLHTSQYEFLIKKLSMSKEEREKEIEVLRTPLIEHLERLGVSAQVFGRSKHLYSIYKKMQTGKTLDDIYDMFAIRVIVKDPLDCYKALGIVHMNWIPVQYRLKDYIATPKANGYQSLHTAVIGPKGKMFEVQIRTDLMNSIAEDGVAAHWLYKEETYGGKDAWLKMLGDLPKDLSDHSEFMDFFKIDLFQSEIFLFTPKGDLIQLPRGSSVLDFAFAVHTDLGLHCVAGKINGKAAPLNTTLKSGSTIEIIKAKHQAPTNNWLNWVKTAKAKRDIRHWLKIKSHDHSLALGQELFAGEVKKLGYDGDIKEKLQTLFPHYKDKDIEMFYTAIGMGEIPVQIILDRLFPEKQLIKSRKKTLLSFLLPGKTQKSAEHTGLIINTPDDVSIHFGKCCQPLPGDRIVGYLIRERGLEIHRHACTRGMMLLEKAAQSVDVSWDPENNNTYRIKLQVIASDRTYLLSDIAKVFSELGCNILHANVQQKSARSYFIFLVDLKNRHQLNTLYRELRKVKDVKKISRELLFKEDFLFHE
jgi:GTP pyrophosphokinase